MEVLLIFRVSLTEPLYEQRTGYVSLDITSITPLTENCRLFEDKVKDISIQLVSRLKALGSCMWQMFKNGQQHMNRFYWIVFYSVSFYILFYLNDDWCQYCGDKLHAELKDFGGHVRSCHDWLLTQYYHLEMLCWLAFSQPEHTHM